MRRVTLIGGLVLLLVGCEGAQSTPPDAIGTPLAPATATEGVNTPEPSPTPEIDATTGHTLTPLPTVHPLTATATTAPEGATPTRVVWVIWEVQLGDTLAGIGARCGVDWPLIAAWQSPPLQSPYLLEVGDEIYVPGVEVCE